jgi:hypothetical protein
VRETPQPVCRQTPLSKNWEEKFIPHSPLFIENDSTLSISKKERKANFTLILKSYGPDEGRKILPRGFLHSNWHTLSKIGLSVLPKRIVQSNEQ